MWWFARIPKRFRRLLSISSATSVTTTAAESAGKRSGGSHLVHQQLDADFFDQVVVDLGKIFEPILR